jgi:hypothetical protein
MAKPIINHLERLTIGEWAPTQMQTALSQITPLGQTPEPAVPILLGMILQGPQPTFVDTSDKITVR